MSVYCGFGTRKLENIYNTHIEKMLYLLQTKILKIDQNDRIDETKFR